MPHSRSGSALLVLLGTLTGACFYDHSVTQAIIERQRRAKQAEGKAIAARAPAQPITQHGGVRVFVAQDYRAQHPNWAEDVRDLVDDANGVLGPLFGFRLEVAGVSPWEARCSAAELAACLDELVHEQPAAPAEWVVGLVGSLPRFTTSFDDLGMAKLTRRHFVLRDVADLAERAEIDRAFDTMTSARRDEIYRRRKRHKRLASFLHEWAHTFGANHVPQNDSLLHAAYDDNMSAFDDDSAGLITRALPAQLAPEPAPVSAPEPAPATAMTSGPSRATHAGVASTHDPQLDTLSEAERTRYHEAEALLAQDEPLQALTLLEPLLDTQVNVRAVQRLGCGLLMHVGDAAKAQTVCTRALRAAQ